MRGIFFMGLVVLILGLAVPAPAAEEGSPAHEAAEAIRKMEQVWIDAAKKKDTGPLESMLADDWTLTNPVGQVVGKEQFIDKVKDGTFKIDTGQYTDVKVRVYGDAAVVTGRVNIQGNWGDSDVSGDYAFTDTFIKHDGKWQEVAGQVTRATE